MTTKAIQRRRGTTAEHSTFTGLNGEITIDTDKKTVVVHDGTTAGGSPLATEDSPVFTGDLSIADKIVHTGDTNTAIRFPANDTVAIETAGSEALRVDSSGNVGIGTTSPAELLHIVQTDTNNVATFAKFSNTTNATTGFDIGVVNNTGDAILYNREETAMRFATGDTEAMRIDSSGNVGIGTTSPFSLKLHVRPATDVNFGVYNATTTLRTAAFNDPFNAFIDWQLDASTFRFRTNTIERLRIDSSGNVGIGTSSPTARLDVSGQIVSNDSPAFQKPSDYWSSAYYSVNNLGSLGTTGSFRVSLTSNGYRNSSNQWTTYNADSETGAAQINLDPNGYIQFCTEANKSTGSSSTVTERIRLDNGGNLMVGTTNVTPALDNVSGIAMQSNGTLECSRSGSTVLRVNRAQDGTLVGFYSAGDAEGSISVSGSTVSYNGGHLSRWAQTQSAKDESLKKGTVLSNLDEMNVYVDKDGNPVENEQLNKVKVSDVEGDANVAGVFVNWDYDEAHDVDEINMAMTGDMIIRIAQGVTVQRGDLLMSAGDGTAKPQGDDIVRSKTIAKVTSTHVTCTYEDGSYCVPCVLMAC